MLTESREFDRNEELPASLNEDGIFRYCNFDGLQFEGSPGCFDGALIGCVFRDVEWYLSMFNTADLISTKFINCTFLGTKFASCRLIECVFEHCRFDLDNLGGPCGFHDCLLVETRFAQCRLVLENPHDWPVFERNRSYGLTQVASTGFDGLFTSSL